MTSDGTAHESSELVDASSRLPEPLFETGSNDYELYEVGDEFVLTVEMPGFATEDISVSLDDGSG